MSVTPTSDCSTPPPATSPSSGAKANIPEVATLLSFLENWPLDVPPLTWAQPSYKPQQVVRPPPGLGEPCFFGTKPCQSGGLPMRVGVEVPKHPHLHDSHSCSAG
ncbi:unnamed protein product [Symbiodinium necroappetens]|uniref:Uncharacterized protein n=1 Tax=Symbiodinium necroappetens TaxID=1628268 RepID=A0A812X767_9DINO|nr:unnamed protein product [Symbiodinium necroappetens]